jgi:hypothetical protein
MLFAVVPTPGDRVWSVSFPVIDHRFPIVWRAAYANRVLDRARELRAQAVG